MARASTKLSDSNLIEFKEIVTEITPKLKSLDGIIFEHLSEKDELAVESVYDAIEKALIERKISGSETMITKILMTVWGQTPAFDRYFVKTYREYFPPKPVDYFKALKKLSDVYNENWKQALQKLDKEQAYTTAGNKIPVARLIDMAFWNID